MKQSWIWLSNRLHIYLKSLHIVLAIDKQIALMGSFKWILKGLHKKDLLLESSNFKFLSVSGFMQFYDNYAVSFFNGITWCEYYVGA